MAPVTSAPFIDHVRELRRRILWSLLFIGVGSGVGYYFYEKLLYVLQLPYGKDLYYTTPTGALSFLIKVCLTFGFVIALPMVTYQLLAFIAPVVKIHTRRAIATYLFTSVILAAVGVGFAYFISLPAALHFLVNFGNPESVQALITANEYFNFVLAYLAGFAVLFQIPLIVMGINRMTPLKPLKLLGSTKYVVLLSFVVSAILTPTPDPINQAIMAGPMIVLYLLSIILVAIFNRPVSYPENKFSAPIQMPAQPKPMFATSAQPAVIKEVSSSLVTNQVVFPAQSINTPKQRVMSDIVRPVRSSRANAAYRQPPPRPVPVRPAQVFQVRRAMDIIAT